MPKRVCIKCCLEHSVKYRKPVKKKVRKCDMCGYTYNHPVVMKTDVSTISITGQCEDCYKQNLLDYPHDSFDVYETRSDSYTCMCCCKIIN